jgi:Hemerythrin HHE cation binding domain
MYHTHPENFTVSPITQSATPRVDVYRHVHKALRALMADTLLNQGRMDPDDNLELAEATNQVLTMAAACESHVVHENSFVHPAMETRAPGSATVTEDDHRDHLEAILRLGCAVDEMRAARQGERDALALSLYHHVAGFVAHNFEHMQVEESVNNALLWACYSDEELKAIHDDLLASIPPQEMMALLRWAVPYMNASERVVVLLDMKEHLPAPAFQAVLEMARPHLRRREWEKLEFALALQ